MQEKYHLNSMIKAIVFIEYLLIMEIKKQLKLGRNQKMK